MPTFLLRLEAVNFGESCYDTNDLSTIRGGSMMMSNAHELIRQKLPSELQREPASCGASHAIWEFAAADDSKAEEVRVATLRALAQDKLLQHGTFVCAVLSKTDGEAEDVQQLRMLNRWNQFQQPTVTAPDLPDPTGRDDRRPYCELDRVRPSVATIHKGNDNYRVSASTRARREYGKRQKQEFYRGLIQEEVSVVNELRELAAHPAPSHRLTGKIAVIYVDGNKQSEMAAQLGLTDLGRFRTYVRNKYREFLTALLRDIVATRPNARESSEWYFWDASEEEHQIRLETLLWGGDDIILVVPAWQGWSVMRRFYQAARTWEFRGTKFTHSAGIVFCGGKAAIQSMREFADQLVIHCKKRGGEQEYRDLISYEVLESFDIPKADLDHWWASRLRLPSGDSDDLDTEVASWLLVTPDQMAGIEELIREVRKVVADPDSEIARRQIESRARDMSRHPMEDSAFDNEVKQYFHILPAFTALMDLTAQSYPSAPYDLSTRSTLFHLTALWDYIT